MIARAIIDLVLLCLFSLLGKAYILGAALTLALLSTFHITRIQRLRIEKLEDEYKGQRAINLSIHSVTREHHVLALTTITPPPKQFARTTTSKSVCINCAYAGRQPHAHALITTAQPQR